MARLLLVVAAVGSLRNSGPNVVLRVARTLQVAGVARFPSLHKVAVGRHRVQRHADVIVAATVVVVVQTLTVSIGKCNAAAGIIRLQVAKMHLDAAALIVRYLVPRHAAVVVAAALAGLRLELGVEHCTPAKVA